MTKNMSGKGRMDIARARALSLAVLALGLLSELIYSQSNSLGTVLEGRLLGDGGEPLKGWVVYSSTSLNAGRHVLSKLWSSEVKTDEQGRFQILSQPAGGLLLLAGAPDKTALVVRESFVLDGSEQLFYLSPRDRFSAFVEGSVVGVDGLPLSGVVVNSWTSVESHEEIARNGHFRVGPMRPGSHILNVAHAEYGRAKIMVDVEEGGVCDIGTISLRPPGRIVVREVLIDNGAPVGRGVVTQVLQGALVVSEIQCFNGVGASEPLQPGRYLLRSRSTAWWAPDKFVTLESGDELEVELPLKKGHAQCFKFRIPEHDPSTRISVRVSSPEGVTVGEYDSVYRKQGQFLVCVDGLSEGAFVAEAECSSSRKARVEFSVGARIDARLPLRNGVISVEMND